MLELRPYQQDMIDRTRTSLSKHIRTILQSPTGSGKTAIAVFMMSRAASQGKSAFFIVHQNELINQTAKALWNQKLEHGLIVSGKVQSKMPIQLASVQTLVNRLDKYPEPDLIIIDEAHRAAANTYQRVLDAYPRAKVVGLTATPRRTDGKALSGLFNDIVHGPSIRQLIDAGYLCDYDIYAPTLASAEGVKTRAGDWAKDELEQIVDKPTITGDAVQHYNKLTPGKRCVVMCVTVKHAHHVADSYTAAGIPAACLEGRMSNAERGAILERFERGELLVLTNVQLLIEGVDIPGIEVIQWLRHTQSIIVFMQGNGRGLRPADGKDGLVILDHVGNTMRHGLPCEDREWSLEGKKRRKSSTDDDAGFRVQQCGSCFAVFRPPVDNCPRCGAPVERKEREIEEREGELQKLEIAAVRREKRREQGAARSLSDLVSLGVRKGMKNPAGWAANVFAARENRKPTTVDFKLAKQEAAKL